MRKATIIVVSLVVVMLFFGSTLYAAKVRCDLMSTGKDQTAPESQTPESQQVLSNAPIPKTASDLKQLVIELQNATPVSKRIDSDHDGLYDSVEAVIGTDPHSNDTDHDGLTDYAEIMVYGTNPLKADSNGDGLFDYQEVNAPSDLDHDGILNAYDPDNDGDGVPDGFDLSPMATSTVGSSFQISVHTDGKPTYLTFQVVPANPEHLKLVYQTWDWPDGDNQGQMQDLDGSKNDLYLMPYLRIESNTFPSQADMNEYGVLGPDTVGDIPNQVSAISVPLTPVYDDENVVAFNGRMLYANSTPTNIDLTAQLEWRVEGVTDVNVTTLQFNGKYLSYDNNLVATANNSDSSRSPELEWDTIQDSAGISTVAIRIVNGPYLSVAPDGKTLVFNGTSIGQRETFRFYKAQKWLMAYNGNCTCVQPDGTLSLDYYNRATVQLSSTIRSSTIQPVRYTEPFRLTGLSVQEFYGTSAGIFYNVGDKNQTIAEHWFMNYRFVNNATTTLSEMPGLLQGDGVTVDYQNVTAMDEYAALNELSNNVIPAALASAAPNEAIPITIAIEDRSKSVDLSQVETGSYVFSGSCSVDLTSSKLYTSKSLKMNWYNTSTKVGLSPAQITAQLITWGLDLNATLNLQLMLSRWNTGESKITEVNGIAQRMDSFDLSALNVPTYVEIGGLKALEVGGMLYDLFENWGYLKGVAHTKLSHIIEDSLTNFEGRAVTESQLAADLHESTAFDEGMSFEEQSTKCTKCSEFNEEEGLFDEALFVIGIVIDVGFSIASACMIADQIGGSAGREFGAVYGIISTIYTVWMAGVLALIGSIPIIGWLLDLGFGIYDAVSDFSTNMLVNWVKGLYGNILTVGRAAPNVFVKNMPTVSIIDEDGNGLDVGDKIVLNGTIWTEMDIQAQDIYDFWDMFDVSNPVELESLMQILGNWEYYPANAQSLSYIIPWVTVSGPNGSSAVTPPGQTLQQIAWDYLFNTPLLNATYQEYQRYDQRLQQLVYHHVFDWEKPYSTWIIPKIAMNNFPITTTVSAAYKVATWWENEPVWHFWGPVYHTDWLANFTQFTLNTQYYDIFPQNLTAFLSWSTITLNDRDGDGLNNTQEYKYGTSPLLSDTDGDGLSDKYEIDHGLNPLSADTDHDGVPDGEEVKYHTNATNVDTDGDGLTDYQEITGWIVTFDYLGNTSLPFQIHVTSDPLSNDTDGDGISDYTEYQCNTNPMTNDTNGDGIPDAPIPECSSKVGSGNYVDWTMGGTSNVVNDISVDSQGNVYANGIADPVSGNNMIRVYNSSLNQLTLPSNTVFNNMTYLPSGSRLASMAIDESNNWLYAQVSPFSSNAIQRYNLNGTIVNPGSWTPILNKNITDIDIGSDGKIYAAVWDTGDLQVGGFRIYSSDGTPIATYGHLGPAENQTDHITRIAVDEKYGWVYLCDKQLSYGKPDRVIRMRLSDGTYGGTLVSDFTSVTDVAVDSDGFVYVLGQMGNAMCVRKFSPTGVEDTGFRFYGNGIENFTTAASQLAVGSDMSIYVLDWVSVGTPSTSRIWKFSQNIQYTSSQVPNTNDDWDGDGLSNELEINGWNITVHFQNGTKTFHVTSNPYMNDTDSDGLSDYQEYKLGSNPRSPDTDGDGLSDYQEWWEDMHSGTSYLPPMLSPGMGPTNNVTSSMSTDPSGPSLNNWDTDGDLLGDGIEHTFGSSPVKNDTDGDGLSDLTEFIYNSNPNCSDTDHDGAPDALELAMNSSLLSPDSDHDLILDGAEYKMGTNATCADSDGDGIPDGYELYYGTNPLNNDTDGDGLSDSVEIDLHLNPLCNDTDGDGIPDGEEFKLGTSPWLADSNFDGIPDGEDPTTYAKWKGPIILVLGPNPSNDSLGFASALASYTNVITTSVDGLLSDYKNSSYVVLVGEPDPNGTSLEALEYNLLKDTGTTLDNMMQAGSRGVASRLGVWTANQTVIMLATARQEDALVVLQMLRGRNVTILPDSIRLEYAKQFPSSSGSIEYAISLNEYDIVHDLDANVTIYLSGPATPTISLVRYNETTTPHPLNVNTGLNQNDVSLGIYLDVSVSFQGTNAFEGAMIEMYYTKSELDLTHNGHLGDLGDINETSLSVYFYNDSEGRWVKITEDLPWVLSIGQNTTDVNLYGKEYAGFVWVQVTQLHMFALAGQIIQPGLYGTWMTVIAIIIASFAFVGAVVVFRKYKKKERHGNYSKLLDDLTD